jgi:hypothetical protein
LLSRQPLGPGILFNEHMEGDGETVFRHAGKLGLEGIVSKRKASAYRSGRSPRLAQDEELGCTGRETGRGGRRLFRYGTRHRRQALPRWPQNFLPEGWQRGRKPRHELPRCGGAFLSTQEHEAVATVGVAAPLFSLSYKGAGNPATTKAGVAGFSFPRGTRNLRGGRRRWR